jgi:hypothetical protein
VKAQAVKSFDHSLVDFMTFKDSAIKKNQENNYFRQSDAPQI